ncbi:MAG: relaxase/mobilization nuclease domain-containing protein [Phenylobacterium sp.]|uniref:relaxase/mobilization nuclease domain-containing protein n=1 Tax=Phenylobacterium sp. TaxID=1871053 RepID=UPI0027241EA8|nr:relaxase/mobilization nuclease domain-containing protein [Phenylobacterium sp.]MDO8912195.1 relaxase/mobilization nuclease domain-containing protein [Phenylobacterium sp.]MDP2012330.1 relaxase/mobilization nuclease domain-containing protein [Phenylobacterium sp.]MDP3100180.1 relaxase/mobilization nuclease domain-containing protein [Phenylobacterium sp.]
MSDFIPVQGFEDVWRPAVRQRQVRPQTVLSKAGLGADPRPRLARLAAKAPEVMVKVTGRTRDAAHLRAHLDYISRNGELPLEGPDGVLFGGRREVRDLAADWGVEAMADTGRRGGSPMSHSLVLSMPAGTDPGVVRDAARAFAADMFAGRHDYVFTLHTDTARPHVHLSICSRGHDGRRFNPKKADLELFRRSFAQALRDRGVEAEATPRRARGVTRKPVRGPVRRMLERHAAGQGPVPKVARAALREGARTAFQGDRQPRPWETASLRRQQRVRELYLAQARALQASPDVTDRKLGDAVAAFVRDMPRPDFERLALARHLRASNQASRESAPPRPPAGNGRERDR